MKTHRTAFGTAPAISLGPCAAFAAAFAANARSHAHVTSVAQLGRRNPGPRDHHLSFQIWRR